MVDGRVDGWSRREVLAGIGSVGASAAAGCADSPGSRTPSKTGSSRSEAATTPAAEPTDRDAEPGGGATIATRTASGGGTRTATGIGTDTEASDEYERTTVAASDRNGTRLATVGVRVADTSDRRYTGLSDTDSLAPDEGMWFVHPEEGRQAYVMRGMSFPLDIIFVDANGTVTRVVHADVEGTDAPYEARAKYVLEVNRGWANRTGLEAGDRVEPA